MEISKKEKDKPAVTLAKPPSKTNFGGYLTGFGKFRGRKYGFIVWGEVVHP